MLPRPPAVAPPSFSQQSTTLLPSCLPSCLPSSSSSSSSTILIPTLLFSPGTHLWYRRPSITSTNKPSGRHPARCQHTALHWLATVMKDERGREFPTARPSPALLNPLLLFLSLSALRRGWLWVPPQEPRRIIFGNVSEGFLVLIFSCFFSLPGHPFSCPL